MRKEIEVKARVKDTRQLVEKLASLGCAFSDPIIQDDKTFYNFDGPYVQNKKGNNFLRIRKTGSDILFTIKQPQSNELDCIEYETQIDDADQFENALLLMGYKIGVRIYKLRRKAKYMDMEICLDQVEKLGDYIEVEKLAEDADAEQVQKELFDFLMSLGVKAEDRELRGYDTLMWLKENK